MRYQLFEYTRDFRTDYCWKVLPSIMPEEFNSLIQKLIFLRDELRQSESIDWDKNVFFMRIQNSCIACQIVSSGEDYVGRTIYSIRGFVSNRNDKRAIYAIPDLLDDIYMKGFYLDEWENRTDSFYESDDEYIVDDSINPLISLEEDVIKCQYLECSAFKSLVNTIKMRECDYNFIFGPDAELLFNRCGNININGKALFNCFYDISKEYDCSRIITEPIISIEPVNVSLESSRVSAPMNLFIKFNKESKLKCSYEWILQYPGNEKILKSSKRFFDGGVSMDRLISEELRIKKRYSLLGYKTV